MAGQGPIAEAFVEILPQTDEQKFHAEIIKLISGISEKIDKAFNFDKVGASASKAGAKVKTLGAEGAAAGAKTKRGGEVATTGLQKVEHQLEKNISSIKKFEHQGEHAEGVFERVGKRIVAAFSIYAIAEFTKKSVEVANTYERVNRVVERAFVTTKGVAGVTIEQFDKLSASMAITSGVGETSIMKANEQLIAFTNIRNVAGKGNDIFNRTAQSVQDISIRTGLGAITIARSLGKALEDPSRASLVLRRASIILTDAQQKQIKVFQKSNDALGAQKVVLDAIEQKYGGAAKAAADPLKQLAEATNQIERSLGEALLPTIDAVALAIVAHLPQIKAFVTALGAKLHEALLAVEPTLKSVGRLILSLIHAFEKNKGLQDFAKALIAFVVAYKLLKEAAKAFEFVQKLVNAALAVFDAEAAANPIGLIVVALAAAAAAFYYAYKHSETFRNAIHQIGVVIETKVVPVLKQMWSFFKEKILPVLQEVGKIVFKFVIAYFKIVVALIKDLLIPYLKTLWSIFKHTLLPILKVVGKVFLAIFQAIPGVLKNFVIPAIRFLVNVILGFFAGILKGAAAAFGWIPIIGGPLQKAAKNFEKFKDDVNASLDGIVKDKVITIHVIDNRAGTIYDPKTGKSVKAAGSGIQGPGVPIPIKPKPGETPPPGATPPTSFGGDGSSKTKKAKQAANLVELIRELAIAINAGFTKGAVAATKTVSALEAKVRSTLKGTLQAGLTARTVNFIEAQRSALVRLAAQYDKTSKQTAALKKKVDLLTAAAKAFKDSVLSALQQTSNLDAFLNQSGSDGSSGDKTVDKSPLARPSFTGIAVGGAAAQTGASKAKDLVTFLADQAKQLTAFKTNLNKLISRVGDSAFVQDLASKGLASADLVASLASASPETLKQINQLQTQVLNLQHKIANAAGQKLQTAADKANALLTTSKNTQADILKEIKGLSHSIINGLARLLGTKVPKFAHGGIFDTATRGMFGEAGREVIVPLTRPSRAMELMDRSGLTGLAMSRSSSISRVIHTENHNSFSLVPAGDPSIHARQVAVRLEAMVTR